MKVIVHVQRCLCGGNCVNVSVVDKDKIINERERERQREKKEEREKITRERERE